ncbi:MAG: hypothetical protein RL223_2170 [Pseudomonadota bacterium]
MSEPLRLLQFSDLHIGAEEPRAVEALQALVRELRPDVLLCTGDLTQRARPGQFGRVAPLLQGLQAPVRVLLPGNHDLPPLWQPWHRWGGGRGRWQALLRALAARPHETPHPAGPAPSGHWIDMAPGGPVSASSVTLGSVAGPWQAPAAAGVLALHIRLPGRPALQLCAVDTCRAWLQARGAVSGAQRRTVARVLQATPAAWRLVATHHPLQPGALAPADDRALCAEAAWTAWAAAGADLVLSGHSHVSAVAGLTEPDREPDPGPGLASAGSSAAAGVPPVPPPAGVARQVLCASATSWRRRAGVPNSVLLLSLGPADAPTGGPSAGRTARWQRWVWTPARPDFVAGPVQVLPPVPG